MKLGRILLTAELVPVVPDLLLPYIDRWTVQEPQALDLQIVRAMQTQMDAGLAWLLRHGHVYLFLRRVTPWVGQVHLYNLGPTWDMVRGFRELTKVGLEGFSKLEARVHDERSGSVMMRCGWKHEATYRRSFCTADGGFLDEYGYGVSRWDQS